LPPQLQVNDRFLETIETCAAARLDEGQAQIHGDLVIGAKVAETLALYPAMADDTIAASPTAERHGSRHGRLSLVTLQHLNRNPMSPSPINEPSRTAYRVSLECDLVSRRPVPACSTALLLAACH
jgi:hypothetical protein